MSTQTARAMTWLSGEVGGSSPPNNPMLPGTVDAIVDQAMKGPLREIHNRIVDNGINRRTGELHLSSVDFELCGPLPLVWRRHYRSHRADQRLDFGHGWSHPLAHSMTLEDGQLHYHDNEGETAVYDRPGIGQRMHCADQSILSRFGDYFTLQREGRVYGFEPDPLNPRRWRLAQLLTTDLTHHWQVHYNDRDAGQITGATSSWGASIRLVGNRSGWLRLTGKAQPHWPERTLAQYHFDVRGDLIAARDSAERLMQYRYSDHLCRLQRYANGQVRRYDWDDAETPRCTRAGEVRYRWDPASQTSQRVTPDGRIDSLVFDREQRLALHRHPDGTLEHWQYDDAGRLRMHSGPLGAVQFDYDDQDRLIHRCPAGPEAAPKEATRLEYRKDHRHPTAIIDAQEQRTRCQYRFDGRPTAIVHPDGQEEHWTYRNDRLTRYRDRRNQLHRYQWDETLGVLVRYEWVALTESIATFESFSAPDTMVSELTFEFNDEGGMRARVITGDLPYTLDFDVLDRLRRVTDDANRRWRFHYDTSGRLAAHINPAGDRFGFRYERDARPQALITPDGETIPLDREASSVCRAHAALSPFVDAVLQRQTPAIQSSETGAIPAVQEHLLNVLAGPDSLTGLRTSTPPRRYSNARPPG